jgi:YD repeat-containing protein
MPRQAISLIAISRLGRLVASLALVMTIAGTARAQPPGPVQSGTYEAYSPITEAPVSSIGPAVASRLLPRWLEVSTVGQSSIITFAPEGRIRWSLDYGPYGIAKKVTTVDGVTWSTSQFSYDAKGRLSAKTVSGQVNASFTYRLDPDGRVAERRRVGSAERWAVRYTGAGPVAETYVDLPGGATLRRRDHFDPAGRPLEIELISGTAEVVATVRYRRGSDGSLTSVVRGIGSKPDRPADPHHLEPALDSRVLDLLGGVGVFERHEVLLLAGSPVTHSVTGTGLLRIAEDNYAKDCATVGGESTMNHVAGINYDAADLAQEGNVNCVCGFCVSVPAPRVGGEVLGTDEHWSSGPWVRLDEEVEVTVDHPVATPAGPRPAGSLTVGDVVLGADGGPRVLQSTRLLTGPSERLGVNVRTRTGTFAARGFLFETEVSSECRSNPPESGP